MTILIIGGSGFVGTRLIEFLKDRHSIFNFDKSPSSLFQNLTIIGDVRNQNQLDVALKEKELVILLAAEHKDNVNPTSLYYDVNVKGTANVLRAMDKNRIKNIIFTSSVAVFGLNKPNPNENYPANPFNHYGKSKLLAEKELITWQKGDPSRSATIIRPTVIFGENNRGNVFNLLKQIASGNFRMVGKGTNKKSMAYVGNIVAFINYNILNYKPGVQIYNYVDKPDLTMNELIIQVEKSLGKRIPSIRFPYWMGMMVGYSFDFLSKISRQKYSISAVRVKKFCATTQFDANKAHSSGFIPPFTLNKGLNRTLQFEFLQKHDDDRILFESE